MNSSGYSNVDIFSVKSDVDLAMDDIYLDRDRELHILLGHRDLKNVIVFGIQGTVEKPTQVYLSASNPQRFLFKSDTIKQGTHPMVVVVERQKVSAQRISRGRIITASARSQTKGQLVWESSGSIYSSYDKDVDLLYISKGTARDAHAIETEDDEHMWYRVADADGSPVGVTIFDLRNYWSSRLDTLRDKVAQFLGVLPREIEMRVQAAMRM